MKVAQVESLTKALSQHPARLEVLMAELINQNLIVEDEIELELMSTFARNWAKDVHHAKVRDTQSGNILRLQANREGLFDQLPPNFFHQPDPHQPGQKLEQRLEDGKNAREEEMETRKFFFPFEQLLFGFRLHVERNETLLTDGFESPLRHELLLSLWPGCRKISETYYPLLSYVLPLSHRVAGDLELMGICYAAVLRLPAHFEQVYEMDDESDRSLAEEGGQLLGQDMELSGLPYLSLPKLRLTLGPTSRASAYQYLPGGEGKALLDLLNDCLVPLEYDLVLAFAFKTGADNFKLGDQNIEGPALGCHTRLSQTTMR